MRSFHLPGRSPVIARNAMCATSHPLASLAAIEVLKRGGNAIDAAITATALLCVIEPAMTGIGGDCFALIHKPGKGLIALNGSGRAPKAATAEALIRAGVKSLEVTSRTRSRFPAPSTPGTGCSAIMAPSALPMRLRRRSRPRAADLRSPRASPTTGKGLPPRSRSTKARAATC